MAYYFKADGSVNLKRLSIVTFAFASVYCASFWRAINKVTDPGMDPMF